MTEIITTYENRTMLITRQPNIDSPVHEYELELPFYGRDKNNNGFIRVTDDSKPKTITIDFESDGSVSTYNWADPDDARVEEYIECTEKEWDEAILRAMSYLQNL